ncbi:MAG: ferredoxin [Synergistaceae bacterium]|jgi:ferredoxin|nr:ferredoxin [Synergistaceae bacterium]
MKISIDQQRCIGCGVCSQVCPEIFRLDEAAGLAVLLSSEKDAPGLAEAESSCPVSCIRVEEKV